MGVSENGGFSPKSSILIGFSIINHPFWGTLIFGNTHIWRGSPNPPPPKNVSIPNEIMSNKYIPSMFVRLSKGGFQNYITLKDISNQHALIGIISLQDRHTVKMVVFKTCRFWTPIFDLSTHDLQHEFNIHNFLRSTSCLATWVETIDGVMGHASLNHDGKSQIAVWVNDISRAFRIYGL